MNINIGVRGVAREIALTNLELSKEELYAKVAEATTHGTPLELTDSKGRVVMVPGKSIGFVEIADEQKRPVGFGLIAGE
ncbi:DUF3107 domain-containing protein [Boudabousia marimammalium]|uniref:ATP-binding protein n=1 Tax=Boudabousia marimammalium TaxID=156892 RepID=A0A1Q5PM31_9ACTO|nr:DUF3107 domain-containing protein [Boudabousia marimammalium]OKL48100.1 hypothetical protein BM477_06475 [Boudabousia marimammalium]